MFHSLHAHPDTAHELYRAEHAERLARAATDRSARAARRAARERRAAAPRRRLRLTSLSVRPEADPSLGRAGPVGVRWGHGPNT